MKHRRHRHSTNHIRKQPPQWKKSWFRSAISRSTCAVPASWKAARNINFMVWSITMAMLVVATTQPMPCLGPWFLWFDRWNNRCVLNDKTRLDAKDGLENLWSLKSRSAATAHVEMIDTKFKRKSPEGLVSQGRTCAREMSFARSMSLLHSQTISLLDIWMVSFVGGARAQCYANEHTHTLKTNLACHKPSWDTCLSKNTCLYTYIHIYIYICLLHDHDSIYFLNAHTQIYIYIYLESRADAWRIILQKSHS